MTTSEKITKELKKIKPELVRGDIKACSEKIGKTNVTIIRHINGQIKHADTGLSILKFLRSRIAERKKQLA